MRFELWYVLIGALMVVMALSGSVLRRLPLSSSMLYLLIGVTLSSIGIGAVNIDVLQDHEWLERITEAGVLISLFTAGLKLRVPLRDRWWHIPLRLAFLTMAATVALIAALAHYLFALPWGASILLGAILAPTDPVLASDVQVESASDRDRLRFSLTGEAGLNDGTAFPLVMLGIGLLGLHDLGDGGWRWMVVDVLWAVPAGLIFGWYMGKGCARLTVNLRKKHNRALGLEDFLAIGLIALTYGLALLLHTYAFLAVFAAGLALRYSELKATGVERTPEDVLSDQDLVTGRDDLASHPSTAPAYMLANLLNFSEQIERIAELGLVLVIGALLANTAFSVEAAIFIAILIFVIRPVTVYATLVGWQDRFRRRPYIAWFGIRGVGSIYYLTHAIGFGVDSETGRTIADLTVAVVAASVLLHGISVTPLMNRYEARMKRLAEQKRLQSAPSI